MISCFFFNIDMERRGTNVSISNVLLFRVLLNLLLINEI